MEILKEKNTKKIILLLGIMASAIILLNTKVYAINVPIDKIYAKSLDTGYWAVGKSSEWTCSSSNNKVVKVWKRENRVYYQALNPGEAYIQIHNKTPFYTSGRKIIVSKPASNLSINRGTNVAEQPLIEGFTAQWKISTKYGWSVYSPSASIIKVTEANHNNGTLKFTALNAYNRIRPDQYPGRTYITIKENYTGISRTYWVQVKPYVTGINITGHSSPIAGDTQQLKAKTGPENYVGKAGFGTVRWSSDNTKIATVNQSGKVKFEAAGKVRITVTYSDGKHGTKSAWVDYTVGSPTPDLRIKRNTDGNIVKDTSEIIIDGFSRSWTINSKYGWSVYSPNAGIIKVTKAEGSTLTYLALSSEKQMKGWAKGYTYIDITERYTGEKKRFYVKVYPHVTSIKITNKKNLAVGSTYKLNAKTGPYNYVGMAGFGSVTWVSSDPDVATVDKKGNVKVKAYGQARITVTYKAGNVVKRDNVEISNTKVTEFPKAIREFVRSGENEAMRLYLHGKMNYNESEYIYKYISKDKKYYLMGNDLNLNKNGNYGFGVCFYICSGSNPVKGERINKNIGNFQNTEYFKKRGYDVENNINYQKYYESKIPVSVVDEIEKQIFIENKNYVIQYALNHGVNLTDYQADAITDISYQYGRYFDSKENYSGIRDLIAALGRGESVSMGSAAGFYAQGLRGERRWKLFTEGKYIDDYGNDLTK